MILAHGSGIDDTAFVVLPLVVFGVLRWLHRRPRNHQDAALDDRPVARNDAAGS